MVIAHNLGFSRLGLHREMKQAVEAYWRGELDQAALQHVGEMLRANNWQLQAEAGLNLMPTGDFSWYDHVLDMSALLGVIPARFGSISEELDLDTYFRMARGRAPKGLDVYACEMTKWFDTNYHYIVPELTHSQAFRISSQKLFIETAEAQALGYSAKPVLIGPLTYLWLSKTKDSNFNKLLLLPNLLAVYHEILHRLQKQGIEWVQVDEPILVLDLPLDWQNAFRNAYQNLQVNNLKLLLTTYFGELGDNVNLACHLPVAGIHIDAVRMANKANEVITQLSTDKVLSMGIVDGRNVWRTDLRKALNFLKPIHKQLGDRLWIAGSCSLLHSPVDLSIETNLDQEIKSWLAFSVQKVEEITALSKALNEGEQSIAKELLASEAAMLSRYRSLRIHNPLVAKRSSNIPEAMLARQVPYTTRRFLQQEILNLPLFPTTTIGSFPQTQEIRQLRRDLKNGKLTEEAYQEKIHQHIAHVIQKQEEIGLDVLVHGEFERNDMVEYFGELLAGFVFTQNGWVQSYGSRCVKPPIIYGDVYRVKPMTVAWSTYAQSLTDKPMKGMLTGPMTILCWSFVRDDQPRYETAKQIALALRDEVVDLEQAGIKVIQIDEPAFREGLPLRKCDWQEYLQNTVACFRLTSAGAQPQTQIHTHMCYSEFNDIIAAIAELDADVITIETSRSAMKLLTAFENFKYPNEIGPGVYDVHSPRVPVVQEIIDLLEKATTLIPVDRLWVNPDCGLKTRDWLETEAALRNMVSAAQYLRAEYTEYSQNKKV